MHSTRLTGEKVEDRRRRQSAFPEGLRRVQDPAPDHEAQHEEYRHEPPVVLASCLPPKHSSAATTITITIAITIIPPPKHYDIDAILVTIA